MNFIEAMKIAEGVLAKYKIDQLKWWKRLDGTPMLNDLAVRFSEAFMEAATEKKNAAQRCKVGSICTPETCTCALIDDEPNVSVSTNQPVQAKALTDDQIGMREVANALKIHAEQCQGSLDPNVIINMIDAAEIILAASQPSAPADVAAVRDAALVIPQPDSITSSMLNAAKVTLEFVTERECKAFLAAIKSAAPTAQADAGKDSEVQS